MGNSKSKGSKKQHLVTATKTGVLTYKNRKLKDIPDSFLAMTNLRTLDLAGNLLAVVPPSLGQLSKLRSLYLTGNKLTELPDTLVHLERLETLRLSNNHLDRIPTLPLKLKTLEAASNKFEGHFDVVLPNSIESVDISDNRIVSFGPICNPNLRSLNLDNNCIEEVPDEVTALTKLRCLLLAQNKLLFVPVSIFELPALHKLQLEGNRFSKLQLQEMPGFDQFWDRRLHRVNKELAGGIKDIDGTVCGL